MCSERVPTPQHGAVKLWAVTAMTTPEHQREYLTVAEVAAELACSEPTVRRRVRAGEIPAVQFGGHGSGVRIPRAGLDAWLWAEPTEESD